MVINKTYNLRSDHIIEIVPGKVLYKFVFSTIKYYSKELREVMSYVWKICGSDELLLCTSSGFDESRNKVSYLVNF